MEITWWINLAEKTPRFADQRNTRAFYECLRGVYGPTLQVQAPLHSSDSATLLTNEKAILQRWAEHRNNLFGVDRVIEESSIENIPQQELKTDLDNPPTW